MSNSGAVNYRETNFETKELTPIRGEPSPDTILGLRNQLKSNARSVLSNLGGGTNGHLALVLSPAQYALLSNIPFEKPMHPGALVIPPGTTLHMTTTLKDLHQEHLRVFREVIGVEQALLQQLVEAIEPQYLSALRNRQTNSITVPLYDVLTYLENTFGRVTPNMLDDRAEEVARLGYTVHQPIDIVFNAIDDLADYAELAHIPLTQRQTVNKAYVLLLKTGQFKEPIREWNRKPPNEQNWPTFKTFFRQAYQELRETTDLTLEAAQLQQQQANIIEQVVAGIQDAMSQVQPAPVQAPAPMPSVIPTLVEQQANAVTDAHHLVPQLMRQMQDMQTQHMQQMQTLVSQMSTSTGGATPRSNPRNRRPPNRSKYCWTHGACAHDGPQCRNKATGHKDAATLANRMSGSTNNVPST